MLWWIALFVAVDAVITVIVLRRHRAAQASAPGDSLPVMLDLGKLRGFADAIHPRIGDYVRTNWSGDPEALPGVLAVVVENATAEARSRGLDLDRTVIKRVVEHSIAAHKLAGGAVVREAMKRVA